MAGGRLAGPAAAPFTALASPVAGAFLMLAALAWTAADPRRRRFGLVVLAETAVALVALGLTFPEGGDFPFGLEAFVVTATVGLLAALLLPVRYRALRIGGALYAAAAAVTVAVPNALGANITRLGMFTAPAVAIGVLWPVRRRVAAALAGPLLLWQWMPAGDGIFTAGLDPSSDPAYYDEVLLQLKNRSPGRVEIPFTKHHWEAAYVAPHVALARGWERQLDIGVNPLFYDGTLTADRYRAWLRENAVDYVALPDVELDDSALAEAALLRAGVDGLDLVWRGAHWDVWRVTDAHPLVEGSAHLVALDADSFTVAVERPGDVLVRIHYSSHWDVEGPGCAVPTPDNWTRIRFPTAGEFRVRQVLSRWIPFAEDRYTDCPAVGS